MLQELDFKKLKLAIEPRVMAAIMNLNDDTDMSFTELDRLIKADQNVSTLILKAANSPLYSRGGQIKSLQQAIALLGFRVVRALATVATSQSLFAAGNYARFKRLIWQHSVVTGVISRHIAARLGDKDRQEEVFVAGLLHDMGKLVLNAHSREKFIQAINIAQTENVSFVEAENRVFGMNHLEVGQKAVEEWNLPTMYRAVVSCHRDLHDVDMADVPEEERRLLYTVSYANYIAKKNGFGHYVPSDDRDAEYLADALGLSDEDKEYFATEYPPTIEQDEFYKFFVALA